MPNAKCRYNVKRFALILICFCLLTSALCGCTEKNPDPLILSRKYSYWGGKIVFTTELVFIWTDGELSSMQSTSHFDSEEDAVEFRDAMQLGDEMLSAVRDGSDIVITYNYTNFKLTSRKTLIKLYCADGWSVVK